MASYGQCAGSRLRVEVLYAWPLLVGMIAAIKGIPNPLLAMESFVAMSAVAFAVYTYNDLKDLEEDSMNAKLGDPYHINRPLVKGTVSKRQAESFVLVMTAVGLGISLFINVEFLLLLSTYMGLGILYSTPPIHLKKRFLLKQLTIAIGGAIASLAGGAAVRVISGPVIYSATLFFILAFGVNPIVDLRDIYGDRIGGRNTLPIVLGPGRTIRIAFITMIATALISVVSYAWIGFNLYFPIIAGSAFLILTILMYHVSGNWNKQGYIEKVFIKKGLLIFFILQISIIVGILPL